MVGFPAAHTALPGAAANTKGQIRLRDEFDPIAGSTSGDYLGTMCSQ